MPLNKQHGNMYPWIGESWNPIAGVCPHRCLYCYVNTLKKRFKHLKEKYSGDIRLVEHELKRNLGEGKIWFVCSCMDLFAEEIPDDWIARVIDHIIEYPKNTYLLQSKNPLRLLDWFDWFDNNMNIIYGTTIETNRGDWYTKEQISKAPSIDRRQVAISHLSNFYHEDVMISIEPILDFDLAEFVEMIKRINPKFVSIGADSKNHNLPEPPAWKAEQLIKSLKEFTEVKIKDNLSRILEIK